MRLFITACAVAGAFAYIAAIGAAANDCSNRGGVLVQAVWWYACVKENP